MNEPSKICRRQPLKNLKEYGLRKAGILLMPSIKAFK